MSEANWESVFGGLFEGPFAGVANECQVIASSPAAMTVEARTGTLVSGGVFGQITAQDVLTIAASDPVDDRIDRIVARRTNATDTFELAVLTGTPAGVPVPVALTRAAGVYEISLAQVLVQATVVQINAADITDERFDYSVCGWAGAGAPPARHTAFVRKTPAEVVNNSAVLQDDDDLLFAIAANEIWIFDIFLFVTSGTTPDFNAQISGPAGSSLTWALSRVQTATVDFATFVGQAGGSALSVETPGVGVTIGIHITGLIANGATAGNLQLEWAQNVANASDTTVAANSYLKAFRIG